MQAKSAFTDMGAIAQALIVLAAFIILCVIFPPLGDFVIGLIRLIIPR
jgi:hypothetical protein